MMSEEGIFLNQIDSTKLYTDEQTSTSSLTGGRQSKKLVLQEGGTGSRKGRAPRRVLHFSDGTLEEYSTDEEEEEQEIEKKKLHESQQQLVDASKMSWGGWLGHHAGNTGSTALAACDYLGENIAYFLGITAPKYQYELEEHQRALKEEEEERRDLAESMVGWTSSPEGSATISTAATPSTAEQSPASLPESSTDQSKECSLKGISPANYYHNNNREGGGVKAVITACPSLPDHLEVKYKKGENVVLFSENLEGSGSTGEPTTLSKLHYSGSDSDRHSRVTMVSGKKNLDQYICEKTNSQDDRRISTARASFCSITQISEVSSGQTTMTALMESPYGKDNVLDSSATSPKGNRHHDNDRASAYSSHCPYPLYSPPSPSSSSSCSSPSSSCPPSPSAEEARHLMARIHRPEVAETSTWV